MKKIFYCPNCITARPSNREACVCPDCKVRMYETHFSYDTWATLTDESKEEFKSDWNKEAKERFHHLIAHETLLKDSKGRSIELLATINFIIKTAIVVISAVVLLIKLLSIPYLDNEGLIIFGVILGAVLLVFVFYIVYILLCGYGRIVESCELYKERNK